MISRIFEDDFKNSNFNNFSLDEDLSNADYNIKEQLNNYLFLDNNLIKDSNILDEVFFNKNNKFKDYNSDNFESSIIDDKLNLITFEENEEKKVCIKSGNNKLIDNNEKNDFKTLSNIKNDIDLFCSYSIENKNSPLSEKAKSEKKNVFNVIYPLNNLVFTKNNKANKRIVLFKSTKITSLKKNKGKRIRKRRRENQDNIRKKIKRGFINTSLIKNLNNILKSIGSRLSFEKFPQSFVSDVIKKTNKIIIFLTLKEIFEKKELYNKKDLSYYYHNLKVLQNEQIQNNILMKKIFNMKYYELFEEYLNSEEFRIDEINRLKKSGMNIDYINKYIKLSKNFIEFFSN